MTLDIYITELDRIGHMKSREGRAGQGRVGQGTTGQRVAGYEEQGGTGQKSEESGAAGTDGCWIEGKG